MTSHTLHCVRAVVHASTEKCQYRLHFKFYRKSLTAECENGTHEMHPVDNSYSVFIIGADFTVNIDIFNWFNGEKAKY